MIENAGLRLRLAHRATSESVAPYESQRIGGWEPRKMQSDQISSDRPDATALPHGLAGAGAAALVQTDAARGSDLLVMLVDHKSFRAIDPRRLDGRHIIDMRGV